MAAKHEKLLAGPIAVEKVSGERPHYSTFFRWTHYGIRLPNGKRIRLEFVKAGSKRLTSVSAVRRFFNATTAAVGESQILLENVDEDLAKEDL
ncbi:DUF1580 domain-containing protein [Bythopirellula polymerisocia]|uniref:Uncharacterized protein n=1 Tax=Bythopirellula polymerisocia TaxID=2528003 RepID=A0A5C6CVN5_9BACT|nr:DUF1580 domain-containing protein [Bythopirellula polymerisocia]TWU27567.1 hypothetical protein Pla144_23440 [Bythopirellula polymerisocia]